MLAASVLTACSDAYEAGDPTQRSDENIVFANANEIARGVIGLYSNFNIEGEINFVSYFTDELGVGITNGGQGINDGSYTFQITPATGFVTSHWGTNMNTINRVNRMLNRVDELLKNATKPEDITSLNNSKASLLTFRAYAHYRLFAYYTPNYTNPNGLSVIKFDFLQTDDYNRLEARSTVAEIVKFIEDDISEARSLGFAPSDNTELSESFLDAILVKLYSMTENYTGLEEAFDRLNGAHSVGTSLDHLLMFDDESSAKFGNPDIILRLERRVNQGGGVAGAWYSERVARESRMIYMEVGRSLYNELDKLEPEMQGEPFVGGNRYDTRFLSTILATSVVATNYSSLTQDQYKLQDILLVGKYKGRTQAPLQNDVYAFRFTDILLSLAEKRASEGKLTGAHAIGDFSNVESIIYNIRVNRNANFEMSEPLSMPTNFSSIQQAYARILEERRVEFAFEGHRYLDMRRLGVKAGSQGFVRDAMDCASTGACRLEPNSFKLVFPIPSTEMISNNKMVQNPGY